MRVAPIYREMCQFAQPSATDRTRVLARAVLVLGFIAFAASVFLRSRAGTNYVFDAGLYNVPFAAAALLCLLRRAHEVRAWRLLGLGLAVYTIANGYSTVFLSNLASPAYPSWADAGWLVFYPCAYACLASLARG